MKRTLLLAVRCAALAGSLTAAPGWAASVQADPELASRISIRVDPRVELFATLFRLAGRSEYQMTRVDRWGAAVDQHFSEFSNHPATEMTTRLARQNGVGFFVPMNLAVHLSDVPALMPRAPFAGSSSIHRTWTAYPDSTDAYLELVRDFARAADVERFFEANKTMVDTTESRMRRLVERRIDLEWFGSFWGLEPAASFIIVPSLINGRASYGVSYEPSVGRGEIYALIGVTDVDDDGYPIFGDRYVGTVVHEFNHAFVDPLLAPHEAEFARFGAALYETHAEAMREQQYGSWDSMVREYLVRAAVVRYRFDHEGDEGREDEIRSEEAAGWVLIRGLSELLARVSSGDDSCADLRCAMPTIVEFFRASIRESWDSDSSAQARPLQP